MVRIRVQPNYKDTYEIKVASTISPKLEKITLIKSQKLLVCIYMIDERFLKTSGTIRLINKIRGKNLVEADIALIIIIVMWGILRLGVGIKGFVLNNLNRG